MPPKASDPSPLPTTAETEAPGAPISGLMTLVSIAGPRDDEPTTPPLSGMLTDLGFAQGFSTGWATHARRTAPEKGYGQRSSTGCPPTSATIPDAEGYSPAQPEVHAKVAEAWPDPEVVQRSVLGTA